MERISSCRICQNPDIREFFDLGEQPLANSLLKSPTDPEKKYPLSLSWCSECNLVQLNHTADPKELFSQYVWVTGTSRTANEYADLFCDEVITRKGGVNSYILELASNDGTFLLPFIKKGHTVLGIDPAKNIADIAVQNGVPTECVFFGSDTAADIVGRHGKAAVVFARNVLPHVANTRDFVKGIEMCIADDGIAAIEVHYAKKILEELHYDSIYHEHLCYFTFKNFERLLNDHGLFIFDIMKSPISGGSMVAYVRKGKTSETSEVLR